MVIFSRAIHIAALVSMVALAACSDAGNQATAPSAPATEVPLDKTFALNLFTVPQKVGAMIFYRPSTDPTSTEFCAGFYFAALDEHMDIWKVEVQSAHGTLMLDNSNSVVEVLPKDQKTSFADKTAKCTQAPPGFAAAFPTAVLQLYSRGDGTPLTIRRAAPPPQAR